MPFEIIEISMVETLATILPHLINVYCFWNGMGDGKK